MKRCLIWLVSVVLIISMQGCSSKSREEEQALFDAFVKEQFIENITGDYISYKTLIQDPKKFEIDPSTIEVSLGSRMDEASLKEEVTSLQEVYKEWKTFDRSLLTPGQQDMYDAMDFERKVNEATEDDLYLYYGQVFTSGSGLHFQLASLFSDWSIESEQDVKDLIVLLEDVKPYVESALAYTKKQEKLGTLMIDVKSVKEYCQKILDSGMESSILASMRSACHEAGFTAYDLALEEAFSSSFLAAYQEIYDTMSTIKNNHTEGYASLKKGKQYFDSLLRYQTGMDMNPLEIKKMMEENYEEHVNAMQVIRMQDPTVLDRYNEASLSTSFTSYEEIIEFAKEQSKSEFPELSDIEYVIVDMNEEIASNGGIAAYYNASPIDGTSKNQLRVNPGMNEDISSISTYQTVCHESIPGHMYQFNYMYGLDLDNYVKGCVSYLGYSEGYATYVEFEALDYLNLDANVLGIYKENALAFNCLMACADIGIHYEGYSVADLRDYFFQHGLEFSEPDVKPIYEQLRANPATFESYYVGYEAIMDLKQKMMEEMDPYFKDLDFNKALLESGPMPFSIVASHIKRACKEMAV